MKSDRKLINCLIGANIVKRRQEIGATRDEISKQTNISLDKLSKFETGRERPDIYALMALEKCLDVPLQYFFSWPETSDDEAWLARLGASEANRESAAANRSVAVERAFTKLKNRTPRNVVLDIGPWLARGETPG